MSVSPDDPMNLPVFRRPKKFGGRGNKPVWMITVDDLGDALQYRPDPDNPTIHGFVEPSEIVALAGYEGAVCETRADWKVC